MSNLTLWLIFFKWVETTNQWLSRAVYHRNIPWWMVQVTSWSLAFFCEEDTNFCLGSLLRFWFKLIWFQDWHKCWNILEQFETPNGSCFCAHAIHNASLLRRSDKGERFLLAQTPKHGDEMQPFGTKLLMSETSWNYATSQELVWSIHEEWAGLWIQETGIPSQNIRSPSFKS